MWPLNLWKFFETFCRFLTTGLFLISSFITFYFWSNLSKDADNHFYTYIMYISGSFALLLWFSLFFQKKYCIKIEKRIEDRCYNKLDEEFMDKIPECAVCMEKPQSVVFGCGHSGICRHCAMKLRGKPCHICRQPINFFTRGVYDEETYHPEFDLRKNNNFDQSLLIV